MTTVAALVASQDGAGQKVNGRNVAEHRLKTRIPMRIVVSTSLVLHGALDAPLGRYGGATAPYSSRP